MPSLSDLKAQYNKKGSVVHGKIKSDTEYFQINIDVSSNDRWECMKDLILVLEDLGHSATNNLVIATLENEKLFLNIRSTDFDSLTSPLLNFIHTSFSRLQFKKTQQDTGFDILRDTKLNPTFFSFDEKYSQHYRQIAVRSFDPKEDREQEIKNEKAAYIKARSTIEQTDLSTTEGLRAGLRVAAAEADRIFFTQDSTRISENNEQEQRAKNIANERTAYILKTAVRTAAEQSAPATTKSSTNGSPSATNDSDNLNENAAQRTQSATLTSTSSTTTTSTSNLNLNHSTEEPKQPDTTRSVVNMPVSKSDPDITKELVLVLGGILLMTGGLVPAAVIAIYLSECSIAAIAAGAAATLIGVGFFSVGSNKLQAKMNHQVESTEVQPTP